MMRENFKHKEMLKFLRSGETPEAAGCGLQDAVWRPLPPGNAMVLPNDGRNYVNMFFLPCKGSL